LAGVAFSTHSRQDQDVIELTLLRLRAITVACRGHHDVVLENLALRHQLQTLQRRVKRPHLRTRDRMFWVLLATAWRRWRSALVLVQGELWDLIERRWTARTIELKGGTTKLSEFVFHRAGEPIVDFRKQWNEAFKSGKVARRFFHDLRRTAVRNMIRAGVPQSVAMSISGHTTVSMFMRYNITSDADKVEALRKTAEHLAAQPKKNGNVVGMPDRSEAASR
jgi:integrase